MRFVQHIIGSQACQDCGVLCQLKLKSEPFKDEKWTASLAPQVEEESVDQLHKRFTSDQVKIMLHGYEQGSLDRAGLQEVLGINKTRFFALLKQFRADRDAFNISYLRTTKRRLPPAIDEKIQQELLREKRLIDDPSLPIRDYNYSAIKDRIEKAELHVSLPTIIDRAKALGCYENRPSRKAHDRQVITSAIGTLIQHDASHHRWSPFAKEP